MSTTARGAAPSRRLVLASTLQSNVNLLRELTVTQFKLKYTGSALGYVWSLIKPMMIFAIYYVVFNNLLGAGRGSDDFPMQLLLGIVVWGLFVEATNGAMASIVTRGDLIRKAHFPRVVLVMAATVTAFMTFVINLSLVVVVGVLTGHIHLRPVSALLLLVIVEMYLLIAGTGLLLASLNVFFRDMSHLWEVGSQLLFFASAIVYPLVSLQFSPRVSRVLALNPVAQMVNDARYLLISTGNNSLVTTMSVLGPGRFLVPLGLVIATFALGTVVFRTLSPRFAESL